jgi:integrase/recombinase XerD
MTFTEYLQQKKYTPSTIRTYDRYLETFMQWLTKKELAAETFTYSELLDFMRHLQESGKNKKYIHYQLGIIRHYGHYLIKTKRRTDHPAAGVFIKGIVRTVPADLLSMEEMEELYRQYCIQLQVNQSKKIMLGILIRQGVTVSELMRIKANDIKLGEAKLFIRGTPKTNERLLELHASQITALQQYLQQYKYKEGPLFIEAKKNAVSVHNITNRIQYMFNQLRQLNPKIINAKQLRRSVITEWLRKHHLRQVQYMAGHKYVSSTQRYQLSNLDDLQQELNQHHPMSRRR